MGEVRGGGGGFEWVWGGGWGLCCEALGGYKRK